MATWIKAGFWEKLCKPCQGYKGWLNLDQLIESMLPAPTPPAYRVYTALLTQSGGSDNKYIDEGLLTVGVTYTIEEVLGTTADFTNVGAPDNELGTSFVATGTTPNSWGEPNNTTLFYNSGAPVVTVLENTIGDIWFTYSADGNYRAESNSLFENNKTYTTITDNRISGDPSVELIIIKSQLGNTNAIYINTLIYNIDGGWNGGGAANGILIDTPIEIRVYN